MCDINGGERQKRMRSEDQVWKGVENNAKFVIATVGNDMSTAVEHGVQFEILPVEVAYLTKPAYKVWNGISHIW